jgi:hypothetical protein
MSWNDILVEGEGPNGVAGGVYPNERTSFKAENLTLEAREETLHPREAERRSCRDGGLRAPRLASLSTTGSEYDGLADPVIGETSMARPGGK